MSDWLAAESPSTRVIPKQNRAIQRRRRILDAALVLLEERGIDSVTTSLIAVHAGVPVSSIYGYFRNKTDVIAELVREAAEEVDALLENTLAQCQDTNTIERAIDASLDVIARCYNSLRVRRRLIEAVRGNRVLASIMSASDERMTAALTAKLMQNQCDLSSLRAQAIAKTVVQTFSALQSGVANCDDEASSNELVSEWRKMMKAYLLPSPS